MIEEMHPSMKYEGRINSYETVALAAEVSGRIMEGNIPQKGKVSRIAEFIDPSTQSVNIYVRYFPDGQNHFKIGEFVEAEFMISKTIRGFSLPREALLDQDAVYVIKDNRLQIQPVKIVRKMEDYAVLDQSIKFRLYRKQHLKYYR